MIKAVAIVGQGPNQASWKRGLERGARHGARAEAFAEAFCARIAITGRCGESIARLLGVHRLKLYRSCDRLNLNARWRGKKGKGDSFDRAEGVEAAERLADASTGRRFVLLGRNVAECFGLGKAEFLEPTDSAGNSFIVLPHPSGINAWWNDARNVRRAKRKLREFVGEEI